MLIREDRKLCSMSGIINNSGGEKRLWSDSELRIALDAYLYLYRLEKQGVKLTTSELAALLASIPLRNRNESSLRYRFRNISYVLAKLDIPHLAAFAPAPKIGANVEDRLIEIIKSHQDNEYVPLLETSLTGKEANKVQSTADIQQKLTALDERLAELESEWPAQIGHNNPPDPIEESGLTRDDVKDARSQTILLEQEIANGEPSTPAVETAKKHLLTFGMKLSVWLGARLTKFIDTALKTLAPIVVAKLTNVLPALLDVLRALSKLIGH